MRSSHARRLKQAIDAGDVEEVLAALRDRDPQGVSLACINDMGGSTTDNPTFNNAFLRTLYSNNRELKGERAISSEITRRILEVILSVRDTNGDPVINLNLSGQGVNTNVLENILSAYGRGDLNQSDTRILIDLILNTRYNDGERIFDASEEHGELSPLISAVCVGDEVIVQSFLDLRNSDGSFAIDPSYRPSELYSTPLQIAKTGSIRPSGTLKLPNFQQNPRIIEMITERISGPQYERMRHRADRVIRILELPRVQEVAPHQERRGLAQIEQVRFEVNPQSTHTPEIERTVDLSISQLQQTYQSTTKPQFSDVQREISSLIQAQLAGRLYTAEQIVHIQRGFTFVCDNSLSWHAKSGLNLSEILTLVWLGIHDKTKIPDDFPSHGDKDTYIKSRRAALLDKFLAIATTYEINGSFLPSCLGGTRNLIVETLNRAHPGVYIAPTSRAVTELGLEQAKRFLLSELQKLSIRQQRAILRTWNEPDGDGEDGKTPATNFNESVFADSDESFDTQLEILISACGYRLAFIVHANLLEYCEQIKKLHDDAFPEVIPLKVKVEQFLK